MGPVRAEIEIDAPRERIYEVIADLARRPSFTDHFITDFHLARVEATGVGAAARFRFSVAPQAVWMQTEIAAEDRPHRVSERGRGGRGNRLASATEWELLAGPGPLVTVRVLYWTEPEHRVDRLKERLGGASIWYGRDWRRALERLRDMVEAGGGGGGEAVAVAGVNRSVTGVP